MDDLNQNDDNRRGTLLIVRIIWLALLVGQLGFGAVVYAQVKAGQAGDQIQLSGQMLAIASGVLIGAIGLGYYARNQSYKKHWRGNCVAPPGFFQGNLILLALLEVSSFVTLVFVMVTGQLFPMILPAIASLAVQCVNFPNGLAMQDAPPDFSKSAL
tara:strand:+ start:39 stop:509 length:471 start_codon:yes stop_codon:yes gene_type:complete